MRKVRHKNVVQFIGACTRKPNLCIVFEFMPCGSMYDHLRKVQSPKPFANCQTSIQDFIEMPTVIPGNAVFTDVTRGSQVSKQNCQESLPISTFLYYTALHTAG